MNYKINWQVAVKATGIPDKKEIQQWVSSVLTDREIEKAELSLRVVSSEEIQALNKLYREKDKPTNVLSFPADVPEFVELATPELGDIILCADVIHQEAIDQNKSLQAHYAHMVIHGVLHLLGYDHIEPQDADEMESIEIAILNSLQFPNPYISAPEALHD